jgi:hypothetical protein
MRFAFMRLVLPLLVGLAGMWTVSVSASGLDHSGSSLLKDSVQGSLSAKVDHADTAEVLNNEERWAIQLCAGDQPRKVVLDASDQSRPPSAFRFVFYTTRQVFCDALLCGPALLQGLLLPKRSFMMLVGIYIYTCEGTVAGDGAL